MVVFHVAFIPVIMTLHAGFGAHIGLIPLGGLRGDNNYSSKDHCRKDEKLLGHRHSLLNLALLRRILPREIPTVTPIVTSNERVNIRVAGGPKLRAAWLKPPGGIDSTAPLSFTSGAITEP
jgi:hypothetical protein